MLVVVYLDNGKVSDTPESAETRISETSIRHFKKYKQYNKQHMFTLTAAFSRQPQFLLTARRKNTSCVSEFLLVESQCFRLSFFLNPLLGRLGGGKINLFTIFIAQL